MILSLDISSASTGWSKLDGLILHSFGIIEPNGKSHAESLVNFHLQLNSLMDGVTEVVIEDVWSGRNKKVFKILALYHGIAYAATWSKLAKPPFVLMPSRFRKICGLVYGRKLAFQERDDAKKAVFDLALRLYGDQSSLLAGLTVEQNDITDAIVLGLAHYWLEKATEAARVKIKLANPKLRSVDSITKKAVLVAENYLENHYVDPPSEAGVIPKRKSGRSKKGVQKISA